jgi:hypothetical protein
MLTLNVGGREGVVMGPVCPITLPRLHMRRSGEKLSVQSPCHVCTRAAPAVNHESDSPTLAC